MNNFTRFENNLEQNPCDKNCNYYCKHFICVMSLNVLRLSYKNRKIDYKMCIIKINTLRRLYYNVRILTIKYCRKLNITLNTTLNTTLNITDIIRGRKVTIPPQYTPNDGLKIGGQACFHLFYVLTVCLCIEGC